MSVNDILVQGAEPLFFLDYFACGKLNVDVAASVVQGIANGCSMSGCSLIGGETAEMPGMYANGEYDLAGFAVGVVEKANIIDGQNLVANDVIVGLESSGFHSNGYSLVRKLISQSQLNLAHAFDAKQTWADALMQPTTLYVKPVLELLTQCTIKGMSHITGGGITGNLPRVFPSHLSCEVALAKLPQLPLFAWAQDVSGLDNQQMLSTFNCGIGFALIVNEREVAQIEQVCAKYNINTHVIGRMVAKTEVAVNYI